MTAPTASHFNALLPCPCGTANEPLIERVYFRGDARGDAPPSCGWRVHCDECDPGWQYRQQVTHDVEMAVSQWNRTVLARRRDAARQIVPHLESAAAHPALCDGFDIGGRGA